MLVTSFLFFPALYKIESKYKNCILVNFSSTYFNPFSLSFSLCCSNCQIFDFQLVSVNSEASFLNCCYWLMSTWALDENYVIYEQWNILLYIFVKFVHILLYIASHKWVPQSSLSHKALQTNRNGLRFTREGSGEYLLILKLEISLSSERA